MIEIFDNLEPKIYIARTASRGSDRLRRPEGGGRREAGAHVELDGREAADLELPAHSGGSVEGVQKRVDKLERKRGGDSD